MNRYGQMAMEYTQDNAPEEFAKIEDPERFFTEAGGEIAEEVAEALRQLVGEPQPGESLEEYRRRSSRSLRQAEEIVLADHYLLTAKPETDDEPDTTNDPVLAGYYRDLAGVNEAIASLYR